MVFKKLHYQIAIKAITKLQLLIVTKLRQLNGTARLDWGPHTSCPDFPQFLLPWWKHSINWKVESNDLILLLPLASPCSILLSKLTIDCLPSSSIQLAQPPPSGRTCFPFDGRRTHAKLSLPTYQLQQVFMPHCREPPSSFSLFLRGKRRSPDIGADIN